MRFIADRTLGKLVKKLRMLGLDVVHWRGGDLEGAAKVASAEGRMLLTRSQKLFRGFSPVPLLIIRANDPCEQMAEMMAKLPLRVEDEHFFSRCLLCNEILRAIPKDGLEGKVPDFIYRSYDSFHVCPRCQRIYWPGTHLKKMKERLSKFVDCNQREFLENGKDPCEKGFMNSL